MVLAAQEAARLPGPQASASLERARALLGATRPTAVNLFWALEACERQAGRDPSPRAMLARALALHEDDNAGNRRIAELGAQRFEDGMGILTHCNAGPIATGGVGTALSPIFLAHRQGKRLHVYVDETRPRLQGARLTAWELQRAGVPHTLICDNMAASLMARGRVQACITGADRIAANGDTANKIGTYSVAVNAAFHRIPFYVAAPLSTIDAQLGDGRAIPIEERDADEVTRWGEGRTCPPGTAVFNPAFDVTPHPLIRALFTDAGVVEPVGPEAMARLLQAARERVPA
jgi:methylthioribose-1-phosphate isomerase